MRPRITADPSRPRHCWCWTSSPRLIPCDAKVGRMHRHLIHGNLTRSHPEKLIYPVIASQTMVVNGCTPSPDLCWLVSAHARSFSGLGSSFASRFLAPNLSRSLRTWTEATGGNTNNPEDWCSIVECVRRCYSWRSVSAVATLSSQVHPVSAISER